MVDDDGDDDSFRIPLTLRGSSPISQEVSKLAQCTVSECATGGAILLHREFGLC